MKYENIDFTVTTKEYVLNVHNCADDENVLIIDYMYNNEHEENINQMILSEKEFLKILIKYFKINKKDLKNILKNL